MNPQTSLYRILNVILGLLMLGLFLVAVLLPEQKVWAGIASRFTLAAFSVVWAVYILREKRAWWVSVLLLVVAAILTGTALFGYGFNGTPPVRWLF